MSTAFWCLFVAYHIIAIVRNVRSRETETGEKRRRGYAFWLQAPLMATAVWLAHDSGALSRDLVNPLFVALGLLIGYAVHGISLVVTNLSKDYRGLAAGLREYFGEWVRRGRYFANTPEVFFVLVMNSIVEETIYRGAAQPLLLRATGNPWMAVAVVALLFSAGHKHFLRGRAIESVEFVVYALLLGGLYHWTGSLILIIVVHTVRNFELHFQKFLIKVEELGNEEEAITAAEKELRRVAPENS